MTALLIDTATAVTPAAGVRVRPRRTVQAGRRTRAGRDPRHARVVVPVDGHAWACRLERPRPRVTITESTVTAPAATRGWELTERGWAVVVLGVLLGFAAVSALLITQFLAITGG
ncbi:MAG: hypothetical protein GXX86_12905 [Propionibacterium sp.]|nr:hypothetical protein [Propionibacterium sp.]